MERRSNKACTIPTAGSQAPIYVPGSDVPILYSFISIQKRKDLWGSDADDFNPERWFGEQAKKVVKDPFMFTPFNAGPRFVGLAYQLLLHV